MARSTVDEYERGHAHTNTVEESRMKVMEQRAPSAKRRDGRSFREDCAGRGKIEHRRFARFFVECVK
jgi:hypothetical protein